MSRPLYIFDLDGTLALIDHRRPILDDESLSKDERWRKFYAACVDDVPNPPVLTTMKHLYALGVTIWIWSARSDEVHEETKAWLLKHGIHAHQYRFRKHDDFTMDQYLKESWLNEMKPEDRARLVAVFDDRNSVVAMYRRNGVAVFQVADGDF